MDGRELVGRETRREVASEGIMMLEGRNWVGMGRGDVVGGFGREGE